MFKKKYKQFNKWCKWLINLFKYNYLAILKLNFLHKIFLIDVNFLFLKKFLGNLYLVFLKFLKQDLETLDFK